MFPLPDSDSETDSDSNSDSMQKCSTGTDSDGDSYAKPQWKLVKFHLIGTDIGGENGYSSHWNQNRNMHWSQNRFSGNSSAHYYYSHFHRNQSRSRCRNQSRAVVTSQGSCKDLDFRCLCPKFKIQSSFP